MTETSPGGTPIYRHQRLSEDLLLAGTDEAIAEANRESLKHFVDSLFGLNYQVFHELISDIVHLDIYWMPPVPDRMPFQLLLSSGMSERAMTLPAGRPFSPYAELMLALPPDWQLDDASLKDNRWYWPIRWLKFLARFPHEYGTFLTPGHTVPTTDPPEPVAEGLPFTGFLIGESRFFSEAFTRLPVAGYEHRIQLLTVYPLMTQEMNYKLEHGIQALLEKAWPSMTEIVDIRRPSWV